MTNSKTEATFHGEGPLMALARRINQAARDHGFWEEDRNFGEMLMLATSELAEALEEHRDGRPDFYVKDDNTLGGIRIALLPRTWELSDGKPEGVAVELADAIIRCLDMLHSLGVDIDAVVAAKMTYNDSRPYKHGKAY